MVDDTIPNKRNRSTRYGAARVPEKARDSPETSPKEIQQSFVGVGPFSNQKNADNTGCRASVGLGSPPVHGRCGRGISRLGSGNRNSSNSSITPIPEFPPSGGAKPAEEVTYLQVDSRDTSVDGRDTICPETPSSAAGDFFDVTPNTLLVDFQKRLTESENVLNEYKKEVRNLTKKSQVKVVDMGALH